MIHNKIININFSINKSNFTRSVSKLYQERLCGTDECVSCVMGIESLRVREHHLLFLKVVTETWRDLS
jgi:hypothetical protein